MEYFDTIIVGAGLAGCTLGSLLINKGKKVIILEKEDIKKKEKLCGGIVTVKAYNLLHKIYGNKVCELPFFNYDSFKVKNEELIKEIRNNIIYSIDRKQLDDFVVEEFLKMGGIILDNTQYLKIDFKNNILYTKDKNYKYHNLVGADGVFSRVRYDLTGRYQKKDFALEALISQKIDKIQIDFIANFFGYAWSIPHGDKTLIGLGDVRQNNNIKDLFLSHFKLNKKILMRGAFLPTGNDICLKHKNIYFIGDAAGLISPAIGEGIYYALFSAYTLSKSMNIFYSLRMFKKRLKILIHRIYIRLIYNTKIRSTFFNSYGRGKVATLLVNIALKRVL